MTITKNLIIIWKIKQKIKKKVFNTKKEFFYKKNLNLLIMLK